MTCKQCKHSDTHLATKPVVKQLTRDRLVAFLDYNKDTGIFKWKVSPNAKTKIGDIAGSVYSNGYRVIKVDYVPYSEHRLAWLYMTGSLPGKCVDHINGNRADNRFVNLREATYSQNQWNRGKQKNCKSGLKGVIERRGRWIASIWHNGASKHIGTFDSKEEAHSNYIKVASEIRGEFSRHE